MNVSSMLGRLHFAPARSAYSASKHAEEVAHVIADALVSEAVDVCTRPEGRPVVARYYAAEDLAAAEAEPPFAPPRL